ncbi:hypothetical protein PZA11_007254 [Diplocarpon coronariae]|nr:hypothetical protein JHW43_001398 [Diplocarpon mali]
MCVGLLFVGVFGSSKKTVYQARTYRYDSSSSRDFGHARGQKLASATRTPSPTTTPMTTRRTVPKPPKPPPTHRRHDVGHPVPGAWVDEEFSPEASPPPSYQEARRRPVPQFHPTRYITPTAVAQEQKRASKQPALEDKQPMAIQNREASYRQPAPGYRQPKVSKRHVRSGSDFLTVQHPSPQDVFG